MKFNLTLLCTASLLVLAGCSGNQSGLDLVPVRGTITLDGAPLAGADVEFIPQNIEANADGRGGSSGFANTDDSGYFEMYTASYAGIQPGEYRVRINKIAEPNITNSEARVPVGKDMVPPQYNTKSNLVVEIGDSGNKDLRFELKSP